MREVDSPIGEDAEGEILSPSQKSKIFASPLVRGGLSFSPPRHKIPMGRGRHLRRPAKTFFLILQRAVVDASPYKKARPVQRLSHLFNLFLFNRQSY